MSCPSFTELCARNADVAFQEHLTGCPRCRAIVARAERADSVVERAEIPAPALTGPPPRPGDVWSLWAPTSDEYVVAAVVEADEAELLIIPLLTDTRWAAGEDIVLSADVLGYPAIAPVWAGDHVLVEQAVEPIDVLSEAHLAQLTSAYDAFFGGQPLSEPAGPPVLGDQDPRIDAHAAIADDLRALYTPWAMLQVADELGPVVGHRREELGVGPDEFDVDPKTWTAFETGDADPYAAIPIAAMARAVRQLGFIASARLLGLARASVRAHHVVDLTSGSAQARRRRGIAPRARRDPNAAEAAADRYADALAKELGL